MSVVAPIEQLLSERALERAGVGLFALDAKSGMRVNQSWLAILGHAAEDVPREFEPALSWFGELVHPEEADTVVAAYRAVLGGARSETRDFRVRRKNGQFLWVRGAFHREGDTVYGSITDISRLVDARGAASVSENRLRAIVENVPVMVDSFDPNGRCELWNRECERCLGYSVEEVRAHPDPLALFYPDPAQRQAVLDAVLEADGSFREYTVQSRQGPRTQRWANFRLPSGETIGVGYDVTEQRRLVEALEQSNRDLEEFAYAASHDLQEPLRMVRSYVGLLAEELDDELSEDCREYVHFASEGAERMQLLVRDLLRYARVQRANHQDRPVDFVEVVDLVMGDLSAELPEVYDWVEVGELPKVEGDPGQLERLVTNLLSNAVKFRHPDRTPAIRIEGTNTSDGWRLQVRDNGVGIAPEFHEKVFGMFQRLHSREEYPGTGIGLAICQRIAQRHGGGIELQSALGEGATFIVEVPTPEVVHES